MKHLKLILLLAITTIFFNACKKDTIQVNEEKVFYQATMKTMMDTMPGTFTGWVVKLYPNGTGEVRMSGDVVYKGKYEQKGALLTIKATEVFDFDILSATAIKDKKYGLILTLNGN